MTAHVATSPPTVRAVLFGGEDSPAPLGERLHSAGVLRAARLAVDGLTDVARDEIDAQITRLADDMLGARTVDLVAAGWRKHRELIAAAQTTAAAPDTTVFVSLTQHRITSTRTWSIDVAWSLVPGTPALVRSIDFTLTVRFDVEPVLLVVRAARLVGVRGGHADLRAVLSVDDHLIADQAARIELGAGLEFEPGLPLGDSTAAATAT